MNYDLAIQIVNYNTKKYLEKCLRDIVADLDGTEINYAVLVLDNNSSDNLSDLEKEFAEKDFFFYRSDKNLGFGAGHNLLSEKKDSKYTLILNPDIETIEKDTIKRLFDEIKKGGVYKVIGPKLVDKNNHPNKHDHGELKGILAKILNKTGNSFWKNRNQKIECAWVSGAAMMIDKKIFNDVGGFDENFFLYKEDEDLCLRIRNLGYKILYNPEIGIMHHESVVAKRSEYMKESLRYFIKKYSK